MESAGLYDTRARATKAINATTTRLPPIPKSRLGSISARANSASWRAVSSMSSKSGSPGSHHRAPEMIQLVRVFAKMDPTKMSLGEWCQDFYRFRIYQDLGYATFADFLRGA